MEIVKYKGTPEKRKKQRIKNRKRRISKTLRNKIYERDGYKCVKCGSGENLTIDHIVPILKGGVSIESNIQTLCFKCNQQKGCKTP
jgi:5-methylcytosine-specific restriction endonuclease McrA